MPRRVIERDGERWGVAVSGRRTQYTKDEFGVVFTRLDGGPVERRLTRMSDAELLALLGRSQPAWTAPETGYRR